MPGHEEDGAERRRVDEGRPEVGLQEDERHGHDGQGDRSQHGSQLPERRAALDEEPREREHEERLAELRGLELDRPDVDPAPRAADRLGEDVDEDHQRDHAPVDDAPVAAVHVGWDQDREHEPDRADARRDPLPDDVVVGIAGHVEARDPGYRPEAVADEGRRCEQEHEIEPPHHGHETGGVPPRRDASTSCVGDHRSVSTRICDFALTPKNFSKTRSAAGAAAVEPWPPFSITAQTTRRATSVWAGP